MDRQQQFVLRTIEERDIKFVRLWFTDILGFLKAVAIAPAELESAFEEGIGFDGSAIEGFARVTESDMVAHPDPTTFQVIPLENGEPSDTARMFCDIKMPDGAPSWSDPRHVLRRVLSKASDMGFSCYTHPEMEFFLLEDDPALGKPPRPVDKGGYFDMPTHAVAHDFRRRAVSALEAMGISVEFSHHEVAPGQQEIDLRYADALTTADNIMTFRHMMKEVALQEGVYATFMPKPFTQYAGSGMHTHISLFEGENNAFHDPTDELSLSKTARHFIAGILRHARELTAVTNQFVNSYKRIYAFEGEGEISEARAWICGGPATRSALTRAPQYSTGKPSPPRLEVRSPDPACNPYLALAVLIGAGLRGIEEEYQLPPGAEEDVSQLTSRERKAMGFAELPHNLYEALTCLEESDLMAEILGEHVFDYFLRNKRQEWAGYRARVTPFELESFLGVL
ncbi:glutamine synthetase family protein [Blastococcus sp. Marseille-P5729]|uniref:glutamine synthetase family protein n=1 Tax=Blastococcus sp. Marseille-P5729 TaxID=2086582 RepID=UPI000D103245|nr:glutamine synthetase family protein [Blastococcus sp. Marseille-P5729]